MGKYITNYGKVDVDISDKAKKSRRLYNVINGTMLGKNKFNQASNWRYTISTILEGSDDWVIQIKPVCKQNADGNGLKKIAKK